MVADKHYKKKHFKGQNKFAYKNLKNNITITRGKFGSFIEFGPRV
jgi:hypothetical protein